MPDEINGDQRAHLGPAGATKLTRTKRKWAREGKFLTGRMADPWLEERYSDREDQT